MPNRVVVGAQWGDEGKGKIVDLLAQKADVIARYQGGANAGHTVIYKGKRLVLHQIPSGILRPGKTCLIGSGVVVDLPELWRELKQLKRVGVRPKNRLWISQGAHLVMPYHKAWEKLEEKRRGKNKIGTTLRGIGPAYEDKIARRGIRLCDIWEEESFAQKVADNLAFRRRASRHFPRNGIPAVRTMVKNTSRLARKIKNFTADTSAILNQAAKAGQSLLLEGAQGTLLDLDFGTYPYNTSSNTTAGGACTGLGIGPTLIDEVIGIAKAYTTRVGNGPFPSEQDNSIGDFLRKVGDEYGATTQRPRRCGWLDMLVLKYSVRVNGISKLVITKLDVLDQLEEIKVAVSYKYNRGRLTDFPQSAAILEKAKAEYISLPGWKSKTSGLSKWGKLPKNAKKYLEYISEELDVPLFMVSTGCRREQTIWMR